MIPWHSRGEVKYCCSNPDVMLRSDQLVSDACVDHELVKWMIVLI